MKFKSLLLRSCLLSLIALNIACDKGSSSSENIVEFQGGTDTISKEDDSAEKFVEASEEDELMELMAISEEELIEIGLTKEEAVNIFKDDMKFEDGSSIFKFSWVTGKCHNKENETGMNADVTECGDVSNQQIDAKEIDKKKLYGLNLEGTFINKGKVRFGRIAYEEHKYNDQTIFEGKKNAFKSLSKAHQKNSKNQEKKVLSHLKKIKQMRSKIDSLMAKYDKTDNEKKKSKYLKNIKKLQSAIRKRNRLSLISVNKKNRHKNLAINTEAMIE